MSDYAHQMPLLASLEGGRNRYAAVSESEVICDFRCGGKAKVTHLWASTLAGAAETSPCVISRYFVCGDERGLSDSAHGHEVHCSSRFGKGFKGFMSALGFRTVSSDPLFLLGLTSCGWRESTGHRE